MGEKLFGIGQVAALFHLSVSTLRYYEKNGLLLPEFVNPDSGYRYYSARQFEVLNTIRYLRALDMPLPEIADFLRNREVFRMEEKLTRQKAAVRDKIEALSRIERKIDNRLQTLREAQSRPMDEIFRVTLPAWPDDLYAGRAPSARISGYGSAHPGTGRKSAGGGGLPGKSGGLHFPRTACYGTL